MVEIARQAYKDIHRHVSNHEYAHTQPHTVIPEESVRCDSERWGATERKILYRWKVKNKMNRLPLENHTHTHTSDA